MTRNIKIMLIVTGVTIAGLLLYQQLAEKSAPSEYPEVLDDFEMATVGKVDTGTFSMEFPEFGKNLTYLEISPIIGKYGRIFIAPTEAYDLSWSQLKENIIAGKYRELTSAELEAYWVL